MRAAALVVLAALATGCPRPGPVDPIPTVTRTPSSVSSVEGRLERDARTGDLYLDARFGFKIRGPAGWRSQVNFSIDPGLRVRFTEPASAEHSACWVAVSVGGTLDPDQLRAELNARGQLFYLDRVQGGVAAPEVWAASVDPENGGRTELLFIFAWQSTRLAVFGNFPMDRVSSCKPKLDDVLSTVNLL